eukprot:m.101599 g.101599  ORF g.101599 m.101599 type:complete len:62 (-) comp15176_c0_seq6:232-417(-)
MHTKSPNHKQTWTKRNGALALKVEVTPLCEAVVASLGMMRIEAWSFVSQKVQEHSLTAIKH